MLRSHRKLKWFRLKTFRAETFKTLTYPGIINPGDLLTFSKSSNFKDETQYYEAKLPRCEGARQYCQKIPRVPDTLGTCANSKSEFQGNSVNFSRNRFFMGVSVITYILRVISTTVLYEL